MEPEHRFRAAVSNLHLAGVERPPPPSAQDGPAGHGGRGAPITALFTGSSQNKARAPPSQWSQRLGGAEEWEKALTSASGSGCFLVIQGGDQTLPFERIQKGPRGGSQVASGRESPLPISRAPKFGRQSEGASSERGSLFSCTQELTPHSQVSLYLGRLNLWVAIPHLIRISGVWWQRTTSILGVQRPEGQYVEGKRRPRSPETAQVQHTPNQAGS